METLSESLLTMAKPDQGLVEPCFLCIWAALDELSSVL